MKNYFIFYACLIVFGTICFITISTNYSYGIGYYGRHNNNSFGYHSNHHRSNLHSHRNSNLHSSRNKHNGNKYKTYGGSSNYSHSSYMSGNQYSINNNIDYCPTRTYGEPYSEQNLHMYYLNYGSRQFGGKSYNGDDTHNHYLEKITHNYLEYKKMKVYIYDYNRKYQPAPNAYVYEY